MYVCLAVLAFFKVFIPFCIIVSYEIVVLMQVQLHGMSLLFSGRSFVFGMRSIYCYDHKSKNYLFLKVFLMI